MNKKAYKSPQSAAVPLAASSLLAASTGTENQVPDGGSGDMTFNPDGTGIDSGEGGEGVDAGEAW